MRGRRVAFVCVLVLVFIGAGGWLANSRFRGARPDPDFSPAVPQPAFAGRGPRVLVDEAHGNRSSLRRRFGPFGALLAADGWTVEANRGPFDAAALEGVAVLVIANAVGDAAGEPAFQPDEEAAVEAFVRGGGGLLLVADHAPFGQAAGSLTRRFGVEMLGGEVQDDAEREPDTSDPAQLLFDRARGTIDGDHPVLDGRGPDERVDRVVTFTGQSLRADPPAVPLLRLAPTARDLPVLKIEVRRGLFDDDTAISFGDLVPTRGNCQAAAVTLGRGRVVIAGEAAFLTAQVERGRRFGIDWPGAHNRRFALNAVRWLGGAPAS